MKSTKENNNRLQQNTNTSQAAEHQEFLNSLKERLNVDEQTIANLEMRMNGKLSRFDNVLLQKLTYFAVGSVSLCAPCPSNGGIQNGDLSRVRAISNPNSMSIAASIHSQNKSQTGADAVKDASPALPDHKKSFGGFSQIGKPQIPAVQLPATK